MKAAGLKPIATLLETTAVLIKSKKPANPQLIKLIESRIRGVITAKKYLLCTYNIPSPQLEAAKVITPGKRAPTITQLQGESDWVAVSVMVPRKTIATVMDEYVALCVGEMQMLIVAVALRSSVPPISWSCRSRTLVLLLRTLPFL